MAKYLLAIVALLFCACASESTDVKDGVIIFDSSKEYPHKDLKLSDLADVMFIPLGGEDSVNFLTYSTSLPKSTYIDSSRIIMGDFSPWRDVVSKSNKSIYFFNSSGKFERSMGIWDKSKGNYPSFNRMAVLPSQEKVIAYSISYEPGELVEFSYDGNVRVVEHLEKSYLSSVMNNKLILFDNLYKLESHPDFHIGRALDVYDMEKGFIRDFDDLDVGDYKLARVDAGYGLYSTAAKTYISNCRTDKIYALDTNYKITVAFDCVYKNKEYPNDHNIVFPLIETDEYILFCNAMDGYSEKAMRYKYSNWLFMKEEGKIYHVSDLGDFRFHVSDTPAHDICNRSLLQDKISFSTYNKTLNSDKLVSVMDIEFLKDNIDILPEHLQKVLESKSSEDNPVLMVMKFGKSLKPQI